ncbi:interferon alpha/beta receptor 1a-like isoform X3 [Sander vitreus]
MAETNESDYINYNNYILWICPKHTPQPISPSLATCFLYPFYGMRSYYWLEGQGSSTNPFIIYLSISMRFHFGIVPLLPKIPLDVFIFGPILLFYVVILNCGGFVRTMVNCSSDLCKAVETQMLASKATVVTLSDLKAWTWYCVRVQSRYDFFNKKSSFTSPHCMQTEGAIPWWQIFGYFLLLVICFLLLLVIICSSFWFFKTVKATFYPSNQLPPHFQYLCDSSGSDIPRLLTTDSDSELLCDKMTVCPKPPVLENHIPPPEALPVPPSDSSGRHSCQGSGDSGVYSTGCSSGDEDSGQGFLDLEQVKMKDMAPGLKTRLLITEKKIKDEKCGKRTFRKQDNE